MSDKGITLEGLAAAVDALRQELATWKALARKQDALSADQITATQSGATAAKISQIAVNTAAIQSLAAQVAGQISLAYVTTLPATGEPLTLYLVPQGDGTAPNFCNEYLWINNAWELIGTTGAMANNGELTIQVNGVAVGTFTANQATNAAINVTVPTNNNQLVNGAGYVDTVALQAALALKQNSLNAAQLAAVNSGITAAAVQQIADNATAIAGKQDELTAAQQAAVDSGATTAKIDHSGLQTAVSGKAADADVVHRAGAETITGDKTWTGLNTYQITLVLKDTAAVSAGGYGVGLNFFDYAGNRYGYIQPHVTSDGTKNIVFGNSAGGNLEIVSSLVPYANNTVNLGSSSNVWATIYTNALYANTSFAVRYANTTASAQSAISGYLSRGFGVISSDGKYFNRIFSTIAANYSRTTFETYLYDSNSDVLAQIKIQHAAEYNSSTGVTSLYIRPTVSGVVDLGLASNKWKTFNGINPGALSIPNLSSAIDIASSITNRAGGDNYYTAPADGLVSVVILGTSNLIVFAPSGNRFYYGSQSMTPDNEGYTWCSIPVPAGYRVRIRVNGTIAGAAFYPCLGNV